VADPEQVLPRFPLPCKPHPFGNEYHSIADGNGGKPIMWRIKIIKGKDHLKKADETWAFPSKYKTKGEGVLEVNRPSAQHDGAHSSYGQACHGRQRLLHCNGSDGSSKVWHPRPVPNQEVEVLAKARSRRLHLRHMVTKPLGHTETFVQEMEGQRFLVHCTKDRDYVTKIMSTHGVLDKIQDNATWRLMDGVWRTFKYAEPFSRHNSAKHWVDDVNNRCHDPSLEDVWATKWWPNRQFTFLLSVAEVNAGSGACKKEW
jgi:hypothetical protein